MRWEFIWSGEAAAASNLIENLSEYTDIMAANEDSYNVKLMSIDEWQKMLGNIVSDEEFDGHRSDELPPLPEQQ